jgi:hypothetical protein
VTLCADAMKPMQRQTCQHDFLRGCMRSGEEGWKRVLLVQARAGATGGSSASVPTGAAGPGAPGPEGVRQSKRQSVRKTAFRVDREIAGRLRPALGPAFMPGTETGLTTSPLSPPPPAAAEGKGE